MLKYYFAFKIVWFGLLLVLNMNTCYGADPYKLIRELGLAPTYSDAIAFELPDLNGQKQELAQFRGKWILLNFWATWCGPCRFEMPTLESLHQEYGPDRLQVLGISVDTGGPGQVRRYLKQNSITFPTWLDQASKVSSQYQASAIPSIYLISPEFKIVGVFRGAKSWEGKQTLELVKKLVALPAGPNQPPAGVSASAGSAIPSDLVPPQLSVSVFPSKKVGPGDDVSLDIKMSWSGDPKRYRIKVPGLEKAPAGVELGNMTSSSSSHMGGRSIIYKLPLKILEKGNYHIGPITLEFADRRGGGAQFSRHPGVDIVVETRNIWPWMLGIFILALVSAAIIFIISKKKTKAPDHHGSRNIAWEEELDRVRQLKIQSSEKDYSLALLKLCAQLPSSAQNRTAELDELAEKVRFGGLKMKDHELKYYEKLIEAQYRDDSEDY